jgi:diguanylate cyclase (GGDEF)-like protein
MVLLSGRGVLPQWLAIMGGGAVLLFGISFIIIAGRSFNRQRTPLWLPLAAPALWVAVCQVPQIFGNPDIRLTTLTLMSASLYFVAAAAIAARDGVRTRVPMAVALVIHGSLSLGRIPFIFTDGVAGISTDLTWFGLTTLEAMAFIQVTAFLMVLMCKERVENRLRETAQTDQLTGLANRRAFFQRGEAALAQAQRSGAPLAVIVFDLDRFKEINDTHGHPTGDAVLQTFARAALHRLRASDFIARIGGEEFAALLPDTDGAQGAFVALQINQAFESAVRELGHPNLAGTASAGVSHLTSTESVLVDLLSVADRALYEAKAMGRGQVRRVEMPEPAGFRAA